MEYFPAETATLLRSTHLPPVYRCSRTVVSAEDGETAPDTVRATPGSVFVDESFPVIVVAAPVAADDAAAVAWLVRQLHVHEGMGLQRGQVVMSGGLTSAVPISAGDTVTAEFAHLGALTLICR